MCTCIVTTASITGAGKGPEGWFRVTEATVGYDHPSYSSEDHAVLIDFTSPQAGISARVAVELDLESGRILRDKLDETIRAAEASGVAG